MFSCYGKHGPLGHVFGMVAYPLEVLGYHYEVYRTLSAVTVVVYEVYYLGTHQAEQVVYDVVPL